MNTVAVVVEEQPRRGWSWRHRGSACPGDSPCCST